MLPGLYSAIDEGTLGACGGCSMWDMARERDLSFTRRVLYGVALATETNSNGAVST
jgi:hypothetical protein